MLKTFVVTPSEQSMLSKRGFVRHLIDPHKWTLDKWTLVAIVSTGEWCIYYDGKGRAVYQSLQRILKAMKPDKRCAECSDRCFGMYCDTCTFVNADRKRVNVLYAY